VYLGIDLGTSELKLLLLDERHRIVASVGEPLTVSRPQPLWSEPYWHREPLGRHEAIDRRSAQPRSLHHSRHAQELVAGAATWSRDGIAADVRHGEILDS
jgi:xylulokinase